MKQIIIVLTLLWFGVALASTADSNYEKGLAAYKAENYTEAKPWLERAAQQGNRDAQFYVGKMYSKGWGVDKDYTKAVMWYRKAAEQGNRDAQNNMGFMYGRGFGVKKNASIAVRWYRKAAMQGGPVAQNNLGTMYKNGQGVEKNLKQAIKWYRKAARQGNRAAQYNLGTMYYYGTGIEENDAEAAKWYRRAAEQDNKFAQYNLAIMYFYGKAVEKDYAQAAKWYRRAAEQGDGEAQSKLGYMYDTGKGFSENDAEAAKWYRKAALQGHKSAIDKIRTEANKENGSAGAMYSLGILLERGIGMKKNVDVAIEWYRKAAEKGNSAALKRLRRSAKQGNEVAQYNLALMYDYGDGVKQSDVEALKWYKKSAKQKYGFAETALIRLQKKKKQEAGLAKILRNYARGQDMRGQFKNVAKINSKSVIYITLGGPFDHQKNISEFLGLLSVVDKDLSALNNSCGKDRKKVGADYVMGDAGMHYKYDMLNWESWNQIKKVMSFGRTRNDGKWVTAVTGVKPKSIIRNIISHYASPKEHGEVAHWNCPDTFNLRYLALDSPNRVKKENKAKSICKKLARFTACLADLAERQVHVIDDVKGRTGIEVNEIKSDYSRMKFLVPIIQ